MENNENSEKIIKNRHIDKRTMFVKGIALFLALLMVVGTCSTIIFALIFA